MYIYPRLLEADLRRCDSSTARLWGYRVGLQAQDALHLAGDLRDLMGAPEKRLDRLRLYFRLDNQNHAFHTEPHNWVKLTEAQVTKAFAGFLSEGGQVRIAAFLRALAPDVAWPTEFSSLTVEAEAPTTRGRIDLLFAGNANGVVWGAVVEAKFGHSPEANPLSDYAKHARTKVKIRLPKVSDVVGPRGGRRLGQLFLS